MASWTATLTTYEPAHQSPDWGGACIEFRYTDRAATGPRRIAASPLPHFQPEAVDAAEESGEVLRLFPDDISWREVRPLFPA